MAGTSEVGFTPGTRVTFPRGMFGRWPGTVVRTFAARGTRFGHGRGRMMARVRCTKRNGRTGEYVVPVDTLGRRG